jgi:hypothetical protein
VGIFLLCNPEWEGSVISTTWGDVLWLQRGCRISIPDGNQESFRPRLVDVFPSASGVSLHPHAGMREADAESIPK